MLNASELFKKEIRENTKVTISATLKYADGTTETLNGNRFMQGSISFEDSVSSSTEFEIGASIINSFNCSLYNFDGHFDDKDFTNAVITPVIKKALSDGTTELISKGTYNVEQPSSYSSTISLTCYDNMVKFEKPVTDVTFTKPYTAYSIVNAICEECDVELGNIQFANYDYSISALPSDMSNTTCLDMISNVAQITGNFARVGVNGKLYLKWFEYNEADKHLDGGSYSTTTTPYSDGSNAEGGSFAYTDGDNYDGGSFTDSYYYVVSNIKSAEICTDDVVITGIKVAYEDKEFLVGNEGYCIRIQNDLINSSNYSEIGSMVSSRVIGQIFRPMSITMTGDPTLEAGDVIDVSYNGHVYNTIITRNYYKIGGYQTVECNAETPQRNSAPHYSAISSTVQKEVSKVDKKLSYYEQSIKSLTNLMTNSFGVFKTEETQEDGSIIYYLHNKPTLSASNNIWKMTGDVFMVSNDGGTTWTAGIDSDGNVAVNVLSAIGIRFDWARGGTLSLGGENNQNGEIYIYDAKGNQCGTINNNGIAIYSESSQMQVLINPLVGFVQRDASGNDFYGITYDSVCNLSPYLSSKSNEKAIWYMNYTDTDEMAVRHIDTKTESIYGGSSITSYKYRFYYVHKSCNATFSSVSYIGGTTSTVVQLPDAFKGKNFTVNLVVNGINQDKVTADNPYQTISYYMARLLPPKCKADGSYWDSDWVMFYPYNSMLINTPSGALSYGGTKSPYVPNPIPDDYTQSIGALFGYITSHDINYTCDYEKGTVTISGYFKNGNYYINEYVDIRVLAVC